MKNIESLIAQSSFRTVYFQHWRKRLTISFLCTLTSDYKLGIILNGFHTDYLINRHPSTDARTSYLHLNTK